MLRVIKTKRGDAPALFCDHCEKRIEDAELALFTWRQLKTLRWGENDEDEAEFVISPLHPSVYVDEGQIFTLHKACANNFKSQHGGNKYDWPWLELIDLLGFLIFNSGKQIEDIQQRFEERREMGL